jgi:hypothetical protein
MAQENLRNYKKECELAKKKHKEANSVALFKYKNSIAESQKIAKTDHEAEIKNYDNLIVSEEASRKKRLAELEIEFKNFEAGLKI